MPQVSRAKGEEEEEEKEGKGAILNTQVHSCYGRVSGVLCNMFLVEGTVNRKSVKVKFEEHLHL